MATAKKSSAKKIVMVDVNKITSAKSPNKRKEKNSFDMYAGDASNIKGDKIVFTIDVEDKGQDVNYFVIEYYPDYVLGYVTSAGPYHNGLYKGKCVLSGKPKKNGYLLFSDAPGKDVTRLKYKITQIQEWPLQLYKLSIPKDEDRYDYYDSVIVAAYSEKDAKTIPPQVHDTDFLAEPGLKVQLIGTPEEGAVRGVVMASFNAA